MINEAPRCCMSLIIIAGLLHHRLTCISSAGDLIIALLAPSDMAALLHGKIRWGMIHNRSPQPHPQFILFWLLLSSGTNISLITVHAHLQMSLGSDRLESGLRVIACSRLLCDQSVALRYPQGFVNKVLMAWTGTLLSAFCRLKCPSYCYYLDFGSGVAA